MSFKACVFLLIFCLDDLAIGVSEVLKSPNVTVLLLISLFMDVSIFLILMFSYFGCINIFIKNIFFISFSWIDPLIII